MIACLPSHFDDLADAAPVTTVTIEFPGRPEAIVGRALTIPADDELRGRVLVFDGEGALAWLRIDERGHVDRRVASPTELAKLGQRGSPSFDAIAVVEGSGIAQALVRTSGKDQRIVRLRVADFSRPSAPEDDMRIYPWIADAPTLKGAIAAVQLDAGLPEGLSSSDQGLIIWDSLGTRIGTYMEGRAQLLIDDPEIFVADPEEGLGLTRCPSLDARAIAGGPALISEAGEQGAAAVLLGDSVAFVGVASPPQTSLIGAPRYDCGLASLDLPGPGERLGVVDLGRDGDSDLLVSAPALDRIWVFENLGDGVSAPPSQELSVPGGEGEGFGAALSLVELGGEAGDVLVVGAPLATVGDHPRAGRAYVFDPTSGELLVTLEDLEPWTDARNGASVHGVDLPGREELVLTGTRELRIHWRILAEDPRP